MSYAGYDNNNQFQDLADGMQNLNIQQRPSISTPVPTAASSNRKRKTNHAHHNLMPAYDPQTAYLPQDPNFDPSAAVMSPGMQAPHYNGQLFDQDHSAGYPATGAQIQHPISGYIPQQGAASIPQTPKQHQLHLQPTSDQFNQQQQPQIQTQTQTQQLSSSTFEDGNSDDLSIPEMRYQMDYAYRNKPFLTFENVCPPPVGTQYTSVDQGNASPKYARPTMYSLPSTDKLRKASKIPLGLIVDPFAPVDDKNASVPQVDFSHGAVPRCRRCRAYINPAMQHTVQTMICNICSFATPVPSDYVCPVNADGTRADKLQRAELHSGVYDILVPDDYNVDEKKSPQPLHHVFLIDLSMASTNLKLHEAACSAIRLTLYNNGECNLLPGSKIAIVGFDDKLHFCNLDPSLDQSTFSIVGDLDDPFLPFYDGLFADPMESYSIIDSTLNTIEQANFFPAAEPAYGSALIACKLLLEPVGGGQVISILSTLPSWGAGALQPKLPKQSLAAEYDKEILTANSKFYKDLLKGYTASNIGLHLFVASNIPVDLANSGLIANKTGGTVKTWYSFNIDRDESDLVHSIKQTVTDTCGYQGQLKVRCSSGLQVNKYYGGFASNAQSTDPVLPIVTNNMSIACDFVYDGNLGVQQDAHFQAALLFTSSDGVRKVRVINCIMSVTERISDVFSFADQDAVLTLILRETLSRSPLSSLVAVKSFLNVQIADINASYKSLVGNSNSMPGQLTLPVGLRTLSMFILAAMKSKALKAKVSNPDLRVESCFNLLNFPAGRLVVYLYPILISLHNMDESECIWDEESGKFNLPKASPLTQTNLEVGGAYMIFNSRCLYLWLHSDVNPLLLQDLFGEHASSLDKLDSRLSQLPVLDTHISKQVRNLCSFFAKHYLHSDFFPIQICRFRMDQNESEFIEMLYEDKSADLVWSYPEFMKHLHKQITNKAENGSASKISNSADTKDNSMSFAQRFGIFN